MITHFISSQLLASIGAYVSLSGYEGVPDPPPPMQRRDNHTYPHCYEPTGNSIMSIKYWLQIIGASPYPVHDQRSVCMFVMNRLYGVLTLHPGIYI